MGSSFPLASLKLRALSYSLIYHASGFNGRSNAVPFPGFGSRCVWWTESHVRAVRAYDECVVDVYHEDRWSPIARVSRVPSCNWRVPFWPTCPTWFLAINLHVGDGCDLLPDQTHNDIVWNERYENSNEQEFHENMAKVRASALVRVRCPLPAPRSYLLQTCSC